MKKSSMVKVFDSDGKLVNLFLSQTSATDPEPTEFEKEIVRIFSEYRLMRDLLNGVELGIKEIRERNG